MNKEKRVCNYPVSMKLKEEGYEDGCEFFWGIDIRHNGEYLGSDEEFELRCEGREDEIEYIHGGRLEHHWNYNCDFSDDNESCSAPDVYDVIDWLRLNRGIIVEAQFNIDSNSFHYAVIVKGMNMTVNSDEEFGEPIEAINDALNYVTEHLF